MKELPLIRSGKAALISALLLAAPVLLLSLDPITALYALVLIVLLMPAGVCLAALTPPTSCIQTSPACRPGQGRAVRACACRPRRDWDRTTPP